MPGDRPTVTCDPFGILRDGSPVERYTLRAGALELEAITYGATITALRTPDRTGALADIVLGFETLEDYVVRSPYFGSTVGRYGNRIAFGRFTLDGVRHQLATNDGAHHLHGGRRGFDKVLWEASSSATDSVAAVSFRRLSAGGEEGYPGMLDVRVHFRLDANALTVAYEATTDRATPCNLTNHSYFDLGAGAAPDIGGHLLTLHASRIVAVDAGLIPTGVLLPVRETPFDFRSPHSIGSRVGEAHEQLRHGGGYDHTFVLDAHDEGALVHAAHVEDPVSGRTLDVHTTEPGVQLYSGNFLDGSLRGKAGRVYGHRSGFCLETQHFPDSPNQPGFPGTILRPGGRFQSRTVYTFGQAP